MYVKCVLVYTGDVNFSCDEGMHAWIQKLSYSG